MPEEPLHRSSIALLRRIAHEHLPSILTDRSASPPQMPQLMSGFFALAPSGWLK
jgi:hypothetical protein